MNDSGQTKPYCYHCGTAVQGRQSPCPACGEDLDWPDDSPSPEREPSIPKRHRWLLIGLMVAVNVLAEVFLWPFDLWDGPEHWLLYVFLAMLLSHGSLLAIWAVLGGKATPWRLVGAVMGVVACIWTVEKADFDDFVMIWVFLLFMTMCIVSLLLMVVRVFGVELTGVDAVQSSGPERQWIQFSLRSLFSWMTALAMLLASLHFLPIEQLQVVLSVPEGIINLAAIISGSALIAFGAIWITLGTRWPPARYIVLTLAGAAANLFMYLALGPNELKSFLPFCVWQVVWLVGSLWLVRLAGYRLIWRRRVRL